jgi:hypothetical protein
VLRDDILIEDEIDQVRVLPKRRRAALELQAEIDALGVDNLALIRGTSPAIAEAFPMPVLRDLMSRLREMRSDRQPQSEAPPQLTED